MRPNLDRRLARLLILPAVLSLAVGSWAGLARLGLEVGRPGDAVLFHGALMASGFVGTVIALERAVSLGRGWGYLAPAASGASVLAILLGAPEPVPPLLAAAAGALLVAIFTAFLRRQDVAAIQIMRAGAVCWAAAGLLWFFDWSPVRLAPWWMAFLVLTIAGERLELVRFRRVSRVASLAGIAGGILLGLGLVLDLASVPLAPRLAGAGFAALALWLLDSDTARRTVTRAGIATYAGIGLLLGYGWLLLGGVAIASWGWPPEGLRYDAVLHAVFLGFVVSAIAVHAPIILPAVTGLPVRFGPAFYVPLALLHGSVALRIAGDLTLQPTMREWGGALNVTALAALLAVVARGVLLGRRSREVSQPRRHHAEVRTHRI